MPEWRASSPYYGPPGYGAPESRAAGFPPGPRQRGLGNPRFVRGLVVGAAVAALLSDERVQRAAIRTAVRTWTAVSGGVEELKERFRDAEAELHAQRGEL